MAAAKRLSEAMTPGSASQINPDNRQKVSPGGANFAQGSGSDSAGRKAGFRRTLTQQQVTQMAAAHEERGQAGVRRFVNPQNGRSNRRSNHAYAIANEGSVRRELLAEEKKPLSLPEKVAQHDERWRLDPSLRRVVGVKVYGR